MTQEMTVSLPAMTVVARGKGTKQIQSFGAGTARDIKDKLKAAGLKGKELTRRVNETLKGEKTLREQLGVAFVQATIQSGFIPDKGEIGKNSAVLRFVKVKEVETPVASVEPDYEKLSADEVAALLHKLESILDAKVLAEEKE